jgi:alpha-beta hydrolase superfamily lysophospholipase
MSVTETRFKYLGSDQTALAGFLWRGSHTSRAILQLSHGAGEHSGRYLGPLRPIIEAGYVVYAADHRGHGLTSGMSHLGDFGPGGAPAAIDDMAVLTRRAREEHPGLPLILFGHSMGAMFCPSYLRHHAALLDALVLSGTALPGPMPKGGFNGGYANPRTAYDWLSRDPGEVDKYIADPFCGIRFSPESLVSFQSLLIRDRGSDTLLNTRRGMPVYFFSGDEDPVHEKLARLNPLVDSFKAAGLEVTLKLYAGGRHEMLNEINRSEVVSDLLSWLDRTVTTHHKRTP